MKDKESPYYESSPEVEEGRMLDDYRNEDLNKL